MNIEEKLYARQWVQLRRLQDEMQALWDELFRQADRSYNPFTGQSSIRVNDLIDFLEWKPDRLRIFDHISIGKKKRMADKWLYYREREELESELINVIKNSPIHRKRK